MGLYFVTTGWIFKIGLCVNSINQSINRCDALKSTLDDKIGLENREFSTWYFSFIYRRFEFLCPTVDLELWETLEERFPHVLIVAIIQQQNPSTWLGNLSFDHRYG